MKGEYFPDLEQVWRDNKAVYLSDPEGCETGLD